MSKKIVSILLASAMVMSLSSAIVLADNADKKYKDGVYTGSAVTAPDEDEDFDAYGIKVEVAVDGGNIVRVEYAPDVVIDDDNQTYAARAMNGRGTRAGLAAKIIEANGVEGIDAFSGATCSSKAILEAAGEALSLAAETGTDNPAEPDEPAAPQIVSGYVLMNIPYEKFFSAEGVVNVDAVSKATTKALNKTLAASSYHDGYAAPDPTSDAQMLGVTYPVYIEDMSVLEGKTQVTDEMTGTVAVAAGRSGMAEEEMQGADLLFASGDYAYYILQDAPKSYKVLSVAEDGSFSFSKAMNAADAAGIETEVSYTGHHTDITLYVTDEERIIDGTVTEAVVITTDNGQKYALHHVWGIWRNTELGWNWDELDSNGLAGKTITGITYYISNENGYSIYDYPVDIHILLNPGKDFTASFADASRISLSGLPVDMEGAVATVSSRVGRGETPVVIAEAVPVVDGMVALSEAPVDGTAYNVSVVSTNYGAVSTAVTYEAASSPDEPDEPNEPQDENPFANWVEIVKNSNSTAAAVIGRIVSSDAFKALPADDAKFVSSLYRYLLNREPDKGGLDYWVSVLADKLTRKAVIAGIVNSKEMTAICEALGIQQGKYVSDEIVDVYAKTTAFVARLYRICLNREPDINGLYEWVNALANKNATGEEVVNGFFNSPEFVGNNVEDGEFVAMTYRAVLDREAEPSGAKAWGDVLANGIAGRAKVLSGFTRSKEFKMLCDSYGITVR